jgi:hypothetical protein
LTAVGRSGAGGRATAVSARSLGQARPASAIGEAQGLARPCLALAWSMPGAASAGGAASPDARTYTIPQSDRAYTIPQSDRAYTIPQSDRAYTIPQSDRAYTIRR